MAFELLCRLLKSAMKEVLSGQVVRRTITVRGFPSRQFQQWEILTTWFQGIRVMVNNQVAPPLNLFIGGRKYLVDWVLPAVSKP